jgi:predicted DNA-binding protein (MmcQ/YjbR family)
MNLARIAEAVLAHALSLPGAWEDHPWGERVAKVGTKVFLFFGKDSARGESLVIAVKLPTSSIAALDRPECEPTGYGLGRHGWVSARFERGDAPDVDLLHAWIEESYRAVAPKKLVAQLDGGVPAPVSRTPRVKKKAGARAPPARRPARKSRPR